MRETKRTKSKFASLGLASALLCSAGLAFAADYQTHIQSLAPMGYWNLNESGPVPQPFTATNLGSLSTIGNGAVNGAGSFAPGALAGNPATAFYGGGQNINIPYNAALAPNPPFSFEYWAYVTNYSIACPFSMTDFSVSPRLGWLFYIDSASGGAGAGDGGIIFRVYTDTGTKVATAAPGSVPLNQWTHIVGVCDGATVKIFVNGVEKASGAYGGNYTPVPNKPLRMGTRYDGGQPMRGNLDEVAMYNIALSGTDIQAHYDAATTNSAGYPAMILAHNPLGYWRMDAPAYVPLAAANSGTSGSANNGTFTVSGTTAGVAGPQAPAYAGLPAGNKAASFDGNNGYIDITPMGITTDKATFVAWVKAGTLSAWDGIVMNRDTGNKATGIDVGDTTGSLKLNWEDTEWEWTYSPQPVLPASEWAFVAFTADPTTDVLYMSDPNNTSGAAVNGMVKTVFSPIANNAKTLNGTFAIGRDPGTFGTQRCFGGDIDEVAFFNRPLTEGEILTLYYAATGTNAPIILTQPSAPIGTIYSGNPFSMTVDAAGTPNLGYQWRKDGSPISGATQATFTKASAAVSDDGSYDVLITNHLGNVTSTPVAITVSPVTAPTITATMSPATATRLSGGSVTWSVTAIGTSPFTYTWKKGATVLATMTNSTGTATYTKSGLAAGDAGTYSVTVGNVAGTTDGGSSTLTVLPASTPGYAGAVAALGAYAYYPLDEPFGATTVADLAAGRDGLITGAFQWDGPRPPAAAGFGPANGSFSFGGAASGNEIALPPMNFPAQEVTISCWAYRVGAQSDYAGIVYARGAGTSAGISVSSDSRPVVTWDDQWYEWGKAPLGPAELPENAWVFLAMVATSNQYTLYMDDGNGLKSGSFSTQWTTDSTGLPYTLRTNTFAGPTKIGRDGTSAGRIFGGQIDEVVMFNRALTAAEVKTMADAGWSGANQAPRIGIQPASTNAYAGDKVVVSVGASGTAPMSIQWYKGATPVAGATSAQLTLPKAATTDSGTYTVVLSNSVGTLTSSAATVTIAAVPAGNSAYRNAIFADQPVAYYPMDEAVGATTFAEVYNFGLDDVLINGAPTLDQPGASAFTGKSAYFNGTDYAVIGNPVRMNQTGSISLEAWVKPGDLHSGGFGNIFAKGYGGYYNGEQQLRIASGSYNFGSYSDATGGDGLAITMPTSDTNTWVHLVGVYDGKAYRLYRNGVQFAVGNDDFRYDHITVDWAIGARFDGTRALIGGLDEVALYDYALTPFKVKNHYTVGTTGAPLNPVVSIAKSGANVVITWEGDVLESADDVTGTWTPVTGATSPLTVSPTAAKKFYRSRM